MCKTSGIRQFMSVADFEAMLMRTLTNIPNSENAEVVDNRNCLLCGNLFNSDQKDDRVCSACLAHAVGGVGVDHGRRRHPRIMIDKPIKLKDESKMYDAHLANLSYSGAAVNAVALDFKNDQALELQSEEFGRLYGTVVRSSDDGFALSFDMNEDAKAQLVRGLSGYCADPVND
jgi:hypothetical protein